MGSYKFPGIESTKTIAWEEQNRGKEAKLLLFLPYLSNSLGFDHEYLITKVLPHYILSFSFKISSI